MPAATLSNPASPSSSRSRRVKTPTILQMEAVECGAVALAIVLGYFGRYVPLEEMRVACGVSRDGSKASNLVRAAHGYGLKARAYRKEPDGLRTLPLPLIVHWQFNHFLVVEGFGRDKVYLNDPAQGPYAISAREFDQGFTGVVLTFETTAEFQKGGQRFDLVKTLRQQLRGSEKGLLFVVLASLSLVIPGLLIPAFSQIFVDYYLARNLHDWLFPLLAGLALTAALRGLLTWLKEAYLLRLESKLAVAMSSRFLWRLLRLPVEYYLQRYAGEISSRVALNDEVASLLSDRLASAALDILTIAFYALLMFCYDPLLTGIGIGFALLNLLVLRLVSRQRVDLNQRLLQERGKLVGVAMGGLYIIETIKAMGREGDFFARWAGYEAKLSRIHQKLALYDQCLVVVPPLLTTLNSVFVLSLGSLKVMEGQLSLGMLVAFQSLMLSFLEPVDKLVGLGSVLQEAEGSLKRLNDVNASSPDLLLAKEETALGPQPKLSGQLELRQVSFGYNQLDPPLIQNFNLRLEPGRRVAIVGGSGSGKSTIARLVAGLYRPWQGEIRMDGQPLANLPRATVVNSVAVVDQDIFLFAGTIRENLSVWDATMPENRIVQAAKDACIHEEIASRPGGYGSAVAEGGSNFSGGQRQRLEIARALATDPSLVVLDEATSALDPITEKQLDENLRRRGCTLLIIAHRLSTIRDCDEILVMEQGRVVERGTHQQMLQANGPYARLIASSELEDRAG